MIEVKINKEINDYEETIFFGLTMRQFFCSALAVITALFLYVLFYKVLGRELVSWVCILGAMPIAIAGFFKYHGMPLERFLWVWFKSEILFAGNRVWKSVHIYDLLKPEEDSLIEEKHKRRFLRKGDR